MAPIAPLATALLWIPFKWINAHKRVTVLGLMTLHRGIRNAVRYHRGVNAKITKQVCSFFTNGFELCKFCIDHE